VVAIYDADTLWRAALDLRYAADQLEHASRALLDERAQAAADSLNRAVDGISRGLGALELDVGPDETEPTDEELEAIEAALREGI
jgi:hypothetical protein